MTESARPNGRRLQTITAAAAVFAALLVVIVSALLVGGSGAIRGAAPGVEDSHLGSFALPTTTIDLNRSQTSGTYVSEFVSLNNSTSLTRIPVSLTVTAGSCRWVRVANVTAPSVPASIFHNVEFHNVTTANGTGSTHDLGTGFRVCGGTGLWLNYVYWTFGSYGFTTSTLSVNGTIGVQFGDWPGTSFGPSRLNVSFGSKSAVQLIVASNLSFQVALPLVVTGPPSCDFTGQICTETQDRFIAAAGPTATNATGTLVFGAFGNVTGYSRQTATYSNWSVGYNSTTVGADTPIGGFFGHADGVLSDVFLTYWYGWVAVAIVVILVGAAYSAGHKRSGRR